MKRFFKTLFLFIFPIIFITLIFEFYLRNMNTIYKQKLNGIKENYDNIELLILGNSHAYNNIDSNQFNIKAYNMAGSNQSLYFDKRITLKHLDKLSKLKYVLISVDYHSLYFSSQGIRDTWLYYDYNIKYKDKNEFLSNVSFFWFGYTPKIALSVIKDKVMNKSLVLKGGWVPQYGFNESELTNWFLNNKAEYFNNEVSKSTEHDEIIEDLKDFIKKLKDRDIIPILITNPMYKDIYKYLNPDFTNKNRKDILDLIETYDLNYLDFSKNQYDKSLFYNADHLNEKGAVIYSKDINKLLKSKLGLN